jgi:tetratricopeptide (TPR) repeat protein
VDAVDPVELVQHYLRGQNLEQLGRVEEAIALYELAVEGSFDSPGPYDRLIALYGDQALHSEVIRVVEAALGSVHTYEDKLAWYQKVKDEALRSIGNVPKAAPKRA